ncbi:MAG TPA: phosphodiester glycosidase family protein, partial [Candidatus Limnocylindria bacterium]|nr:phosphodiester glycosidase family protein [Candidatus Limnocylindria bacterium]
PGGARTTLHVASYDSAFYAPRIVQLDPPAQLVRWCREHGVCDAMVGGFFLRVGGIFPYSPLGELRIAGDSRTTIPFDAPWGGLRACLQILDGEPSIASRAELRAETRGDLLQAGPLLVLDGRRVVIDGEDPEGFSAGSHQFDSDITVGRYPRAALALADGQLMAVACDGRTARDSGMTLAELADVLVGLGASAALNLDGGGSASLVYGGRLRNRPREPHGADLLDGRAIATAVVFDGR